MRSFCSITIIVLLTVFATLAQAQMTKAVVVGRTTKSAPLTTGPLQAIVDEPVELTVRIRSGRHLSPLPEGATVRWIRVIQRLQPDEPTERSQGYRVYSNARFLGSDHGRWLGTETLLYDSVAIEARPGAELDSQALHLSRAAANEHGGLGTIWIAAEVVLTDGSVLRTPNATTTDQLGLSRDVMRVSFRRDDSHAGWLGTFFHVPYVFGSTAPQTDNYLGTDCADALIGALRASGNRLRFTSVMGLPRYGRARTEVLILNEDGIIRDREARPRSPSWERDLRPGDYLTIDYINDPRGELPRPWDHAAVLLRDSGPDGRPNGVLDGTDVVRHMSMLGLRDQPLAELGQFRFRIWRWR